MQDTGSKHGEGHGYRRKRRKIGRHHRSHNEFHNHDEKGHDILRLSDFGPNQEVVITKILGHGAFRKRITEMGFIKSKKVKVIKNAPLLDPVEYEIMGYNISLRRKEADMIEVIPIQDATEQSSNFQGVTEHLTSPCPQKQERADKLINIALVGNPNCGKTTLFNKISGSKERVGNYSGVTVEAKEVKHKYKGYTLNLADLPGTYSITEYTPEELYVRQHIVNKAPDIVINVVDASNLERNLFLTTQLIDMNIKVVIALNMYDELEKSGAKFDYTMLGMMIGIPFVPTVASKGRGVENLFDKVIDIYEDRDTNVRKININYGTDIEKAIALIEPMVEENRNITANYDPRYLSVKLLEGDETTKKLFENSQNGEALYATLNQISIKLEEKYKEKPETILTDAKYGFVAGALKETYIEPKSQSQSKKKNQLIDSILTHKIWGFPIFLFLLWLTFQTTFTIGGYPMDWIDMGVNWLSITIQAYLPQSWFKDMVLDGVIGGVGSVIIFLPNIVILFFGISLMEDTGYMARVSFIMDKLMHRIGLHGKSFIPLIMGFGCNVPAIMATRTLENRNDRLLTMLILPFMSCSARLPVYILLIGAFFPVYPALVMFSMYFIGVLLAIISGLIFKKIFFKKEEIPFVMELPPYRVPTMRNIWVHTWGKAAEYLKKMGGIILVASLIIWVLGYFPRDFETSVKYDTQIEKVNTSSISETEKETKVAAIELEKESERRELSYIGRLGHFIEPAIRPLGFDWKIGVSLITGMAAKEIVVSSMGVLYNTGMEEDESSNRLITALQNEGFSQVTAFGLLIFILIYFPCIAVVAAIRREGSWRWAIFTIVYTTGIAWLFAFLIQVIGNMFV